jgi:hypothetical protein
MVSHQWCIDIWKAFLLAVEYLGLVLGLLVLELACLLWFENKQKQAT